MRGDKKLVKYLMLMQHFFLLHLIVLSVLLFLLNDILFGLSEMGTYLKYIKWSVIEKLTFITMAALSWYPLCTTHRYQIKVD